MGPCMPWRLTHVSPPARHPPALLLTSTHLVPFIRAPTSSLVPRETTSRAPAAAPLLCAALLRENDARAVAGLKTPRRARQCNDLLDRRPPIGGAIVVSSIRSIAQCARSDLHACAFHACRQQRSSPCLPSIVTAIASSKKRHSDDADPCIMHARPRRNGCLGRECRSLMLARRGEGTDVSSGTG
jgi:hypothetical protein